MQNMSKLDEWRDSQEKAAKKAKEADMSARKMEVALNQTRCIVCPHALGLRGKYPDEREELFPREDSPGVKYLGPADPKKPGLVDAGLIMQDGGGGSAADEERLGGLWSGSRLRL